MIEAQCIAISRAEDVEDLVTLQLKMPKFLDAEFEKHRMISSNSSSDRAIPKRKMLQQDYFIPQDVRWNQSGMQGDKKLNDSELSIFQRDIEDLREEVIACINQWDNVHKQHLNRYLIPWTIQSKVATATLDQWEYFLGLRADEAADPAMQELSRRIVDALTWNIPTERMNGDWHLPYITPTERVKYDLETLRMASVARCARVSYGNHDGTDAVVDSDVVLATRLLEMGHMSPFEHVATPMKVVSMKNCMSLVFWDEGTTHMMKNGDLFSGNFRGWVQMRQTL